MIRMMCLIFAAAITVAALVTCSDDNGVGPPDPGFPNVWDMPAWSPDGKTIAAFFSGTYYINPGTDAAKLDLSKQGLWLMDTDGSNKRMILAGRVLTPSWHPTGDSLIFTVGFYLGGVAKADTSVDSLVYLTDAAGYYNPSWSPDGTRIAYNGIWVMNSDSTEKQLVEPGTAPAWSPDGSRIAFSNAHKPGGGIAIIDLSTDSVTVLLEGLGAEKIEWCSATNELFFTSSGQLYRYNLNAATLLLLASNAKYPSVSPDGTKIAYLSHTSRSYSAENGHLFIIDSDGTNKRQITFMEGGDSLR